MSNKETLQNNNTNLGENNTELQTMLSTINELPNAVIKPNNYMEGNIAQFDGSGNIVDSGESVYNIRNTINSNIGSKTYIFTDQNTTNTYTISGTVSVSSSDFNIAKTFVPKYSGFVSVKVTAKNGNAYNTFVRIVNTTTGSEVFSSTHYSTSATTVTKTIYLQANNIYNLEYRSGTGSSAATITTAYMYYALIEDSEDPANAIITL